MSLYTLNLKLAMKMNISTVTITFCVLMAFAGCVAEETMAEPAITLQVDSQQLKVGRVVIHSKLENNGTGALTFLSWGTPFESIVSSPFLMVQTVVAGEFQRVAYTGILIKRAPPQEIDYIGVFSGQTVSNNLDITESYTFCRNRDYIMSFTGPLFKADNSEVMVASVTEKFSTGNSFPPCN